MLISVNEAIQKIKKNDILFFAGEENLLDKLPKGRWIGGTIPYFMSDTGGMETQDKIFVTVIPDFINDIKINFYDDQELKNIPSDSPINGFSYIIIPAASKAHISYAQNAPNYEGIFMKPIIGWIAGIHLKNLGKESAKVYNGITAEKSDCKACVMHLTLPANKIAETGIINLFKQGSGDSIQFEEEGFSIKESIINGKKENFSEYLLKNKIDIRLPLVANYCGTMINVSFQEIKKEEKVVNLYAPVFKNVEYKIAGPVTDYVGDFMKLLSKETINPVFSCNCILNYIYSELQGKKTMNFKGPITFGEIVYQLLNQTLAYIELKDI